MSFAHAVLSPFDPEALGAQVPDEYSFPTCTTTLKQTTRILSNADGDWDVAFQVHSLGCMFSDDETLIGTLAATWARTASLTPVPRTNGLLTVSNIAAWRKYRVLGLGVRLRSLLVPMTSTGIMSIATLPGADRLMNQTIQGLLANTEAPDLNDWYQYPVTDGSGFFGTTMENYTTATRRDHFEFNREGFEWSAHPCGPSAYRWRDGINAPVSLTDTNGNAFMNGEMGYVSKNVPANSLGDSIAFVSMQDWSMLCIRGSQFPASTSIADVEIIMHIEYIDENSAVTGGNGRYPPVIPQALHAVAATAASMPLYRAISMDNNAKIQSRMGV